MFSRISSELQLQFHYFPINCRCYWKQFSFSTPAETLNLTDFINIFSNVKSSCCLVRKHEHADGDGSTEPK